MAARIDVIRKHNDCNGTTGPHQSGGWDVTRITIAAVMMMWMAATAARLDGQDLRISPTDAAVRVSVEILSRHVLQFAGLRVQVADAVVEHVVSPRAFVLISQREFVGMGLSRERVGVIVASGTASVLPKMPVVVAGAAGTFVGAQVTGVLTRSAALTEQERDALSRYPLVLAMSVQTPNEISLLRDAPATAK
jgi:hypothetical protein